MLPMPKSGVGVAGISVGEIVSVSMATRGVGESVSVKAISVGGRSVMLGETKILLKILPPKIRQAKTIMPSPMKIPLLLEKALSFSILSCWRAFFRAFWRAFASAFLFCCANLSWRASSRAAFFFVSSSTCATLLFFAIFLQIFL